MKMEGYYTKLEIQRLICWVDGVRKDWQSKKYLIPELEAIRLVQKQIDPLDRLIWKWQAKLEKGEAVPR